MNRDGHPLAFGLTERLHGRSGAAVIELGAGVGRNTTILREAGFDVTAIDDADLDAAKISRLRKRFAGALSTHGFLHGNPESVTALLAAAARVLSAGSPFFATFASTRDSRFGKGVCIDAVTFAPAMGDERGVPHVYFDRERLQAAVLPFFAIESLEEHEVGRVVGRWA
ncbi:MAG: hypothetical protein M3R35_02865, partial [Candidatus Eremiobacteraeota bacterium]|nr:hypothetical protein [Candidatus Eremiobacteraeota bacterium]